MDEKESIGKKNQKFSGIYHWLLIIFASLLGVTLIGEFSYERIIRKDWTTYSKVNGEIIENVEVITLAPDGAIWVGTSVVTFLFGSFSICRIT